MGQNLKEGFDGLHSVDTKELVKVGMFDFYGIRMCSIITFRESN